jgi:hypothetical protein
LPNCGKCESAKDKLKRLDIQYKELPYKQYTTWHEGWEDDGSVEVLAARSFYGEHAVPLIQAEGRMFDYPGFMKEVKGRQATDQIIKESA